MTGKNQSRVAISGMAAGLAILAGTLWWLCERSPAIDFLTNAGPAEWIVYPKPPDASVAYRKEMRTEFRRSFVLEQVPAHATVSYRSFRACAVTVNGQSTGHDDETSRPPNWRRPLEWEISKFLRPGTNEISATVINGYGPPALWLHIKGDGFELDSGAEWDSSEMGAVWRKARLASSPPVLENGQRLYGGESVRHSLAREWPVLVVFALISCGLVGGAWWLGRHAGTAFVAGDPALASSHRFAKRAIAAIAVPWCLLFLHNLPLLPGTMGYDCLDHLDYVGYIQTHHALPLPADGMEMYHPPLYYIVCNAVLAPLFTSAFTELGIYAMRMLGLLVGLSNCLLIFLSCRLLFPGRAAPQIIGLALAAYLPAHLYLCHYVTNETLAAALMSATCYFYLRLVTGPSPSWRLATGAGLCLGGALLTKMTALIAVPVVIAGLAHWLLKTRPRDLRMWVNSFGVVGMSCLVVVGWYYARMWMRCGTPVVSIPGDAGSRIWADDGFRTSAYYTRFGACLVRPAYSVFNSFADGIYSTLWGDALYGGQTAAEYRPPWNYSLMTVGELFGLLPTAMVLIGVAAALRRFARRPEPAWILLIGLAAGTAAAMVYLSLKLPFYFNVKGFYGLGALLPFCVFGAMGWETLARWMPRFRVFVAISLGVWAINVYASFWIRGGAESIGVTRGLFLLREHRPQEAMRLFEDVLRRDAQNVPARRAFAAALATQEHLAEAHAQADLALKYSPDDAQTHLVAGSILAHEGDLEGAVRHGLASAQSAPDLAEAYSSMCSWLARLGRHDEAISRAREGLRFKPGDPDLHYLLGSSLAALNQNQEAADQLRLACELKSDADWQTILAAVYAKAGQISNAVTEYRAVLRARPDSIEVLNNLAWILATQKDARFRDGAEAVQLAERASQLSEGTNALVIGTLAAAHAEAGQFDEAVACAKRAIEAAGSQGNEVIAATNRRLLGLYQSKQAYREP